MSVVWFLFLMWVFKQGVEVSEMAFLMIPIFYVGDCILASRKR